MSDLKEMLDRQHKLQVDAYKLDPTQLAGDARAEFVRWNVLALHAELTEALDEVGWKPWATSRHINAEQMMKELVDAFHFLMNLMLVAGEGKSPAAVAAQFLAEYRRKADENDRRQRLGYDGVDGKCPACHRHLRDTTRSVPEVGPDGLETGVVHVFCLCGFALDRPASRTA